MDSTIARILIVDGEKENGRFLREALSSAACKVRFYPNARRAVQRLRPGRFHLAVVDAGRDPDILPALREKDSDLALMTLTGFPSVRLMERGAQAGVLAFWRKPYAWENLRQAIERALDEKGVFMESEHAVNQRIGRRIKEYRHRRNWTITKLAGRSRLSKSLISQIENAKNSVSLISLSRIARSLNVRVADLVQDL